MMHHWFGFGGFGFGGMILAAIFSGLVIGLIIWFVVRISRHGNYPQHMHQVRGADALDIARERYAKGEIDKEQFEQIKKDLS